MTMTEEELKRLLKIKIQNVIYADAVMGKEAVEKDINDTIDALITQAKEGEREEYRDLVNALQAILYQLGGSIEISESTKARVMPGTLKISVFDNPVSGGTVIKLDSLTQEEAQ